jgi:Recombination endonuclease VII
MSSNPEYMKQWRKNNPEKKSIYNERRRLKKQENPEKYKASQRKCRTGWEPDEFEAAWKTQNGICVICNREMLKTGNKSNSVCADHDHKTGKTRGLLCIRCNFGLGFYEKYRAEFDIYLVKYQ